MNHDQSGLILSGSETEHSVAVPNTWFCEETCGSRQSERTVWPYIWKELFKVYGFFHGMSSPKAWNSPLTTGLAKKKLVCNLVKTIINNRPNHHKCYKLSPNGWFMIVLTTLTVLLYLVVGIARVDLRFHVGMTEDKKELLSEAKSPCMAIWIGKIWENDD